MIRVLIAEDSPVTREYLAAALGEDPELEVVGDARDGGQAVELAEQLHPDVILMDVHMPVMDGYDATRLIMQRAPTPIVMATASTSLFDTRSAFRALEAGALMLLDKPPGPFDPNAESAVAELVRTVKLMAEVKVVRRWPERGASNGAPALPVTRDPRLVAIGASTGGPQVLAGLLAQPLRVPVVLVQHIAEGFVGGFAEWLASRTPMPVKLAEPDARLEPGTVLVAGGAGHLTVTRGGRIAIGDEGPVDGFRPSITRLFESVASGFGDAAIGVLLTGMGRDGAAGLRRLREAGSLTIAQDEPSSVVFGMPGEAVRLDAAAAVLAPDAIGRLLARLAGAPR
jgi:two-component system, chemotaxis family, protein-glutamate methylesterase/glutaminase